MKIEDHSLDWYLAKLRGREPFSMSRWGDGEWSAVFDHYSRTPEDFRFTASVRQELRRILLSRPEYLLGISHQWVFDGAQEQWADDQGLDDLQWVNAGVFHEASGAGNLKPLVDALNDNLFIAVGPWHLDRLRGVLGFETLIRVPDRNCMHSYPDVLHQVRLVAEMLKPTVFGLSCGPMANILINELYPAFGDKHTFIDFGSVWDVYAGVRSRDYMEKVDLPDWAKGL